MSHCNYSLTVDEANTVLSGYRVHVIQLKTFHIVSCFESVRSCMMTSNLNAVHGVLTELLG